MAMTTAMKEQLPGLTSIIPIGKIPAHIGIDVL